MDVRILHRKDKQSNAIARIHRVVCDQPFDEKGSDEGMTPPELMLAALGCCAMHYAVEYLRARGLPVDGLDLSVSGIKGGSPMRVTGIGIELQAPGLGLRQREGILKAMEACLLHQTLLHPPSVKLAVNTTEDGEFNHVASQSCDASSACAGH